MELVFEEQVIQFTDMPTVDAVMEMIAEMLGEEKWFSHFIVNQTEIYEEPESYLSEHLDHIEQIKVKGKDITEFMNDVLISALKKNEFKVIGVYLEILMQKLHDALVMQDYALIAKIIEKELISVYESIMNLNHVLYVECWH